MPIPSAARAALLLAALAITGCAHRKTVCPPAPGVAAVDPSVPVWQDVVTDPDHVRLRQWRQSLVAAIAKARAGGNGGAIDREGPLLDPDSALDGATLPPGAYRCRRIKIGAKPPSKVDFIVLPTAPCVVGSADPLSHLRWMGGDQRPVGRLYADSLAREVFLGVMVLGDERAPIKYGRDADRDMVGTVQRIGARRWRMILPNPAWGSMTDIVDITPAG